MAKSRENEDVSKIVSRIVESDNCHGANASQPDISEEELNKLCAETLLRLQISVAERDNIEMQTRSQRNEKLWFELRRKRLTSSRFGELCKRQNTTPCSRLVKEILYTTS